ncbi:hypothetical protein Tco_0332872 [Tanacetum coccineum]
MGDENPIRTLGDYSKPSHKGYRNIIELPVGNNVVPLRSDTIRLVQNGCSFHRLRCEDPNQHLKDFLKLIDCAADGKLRNKNAEESWEIIKNLALYDHEGWNDTKGFAKLVKAISTPQGTSKTPDRRLLELEDQINFLLKGSRPAPTQSSTHTPQAYVEAVQTLSHKNYEPHSRLEYGTTWQHTLNEWRDLTEMFGLLKELATSRALEKVLIREEAKSPVTKSVKSISHQRRERKNGIYDVATGEDSKETDGLDMEVSVKEAETKNGAENGAKNKPIKKHEKEEVVEAPSSQPVEYYLKHKINEKLIEGLIDNVLPKRPVYEAILNKKITKKEDNGGNIEIPCSIGGLKHMNALVDQGSDVNIIPYSTYMKLIDEGPAETDIRLSLASHSYIYPLGIA